MQIEQVVSELPFNTNVFAAIVGCQIGPVDLEFLCSRLWNVEMERSDNGRATSLLIRFPPLQTDQIIHCGVVCRIYPSGMCTLIVGGDELVFGESLMKFALGYLSRAYRGIERLEFVPSTVQLINLMAVLRLKKSEFAFPGIEAAHRRLQAVEPGDEIIAEIIRKKAAELHIRFTFVKLSRCVVELSIFKSGIVKVMRCNSFASLEESKRLLLQHIFHSGY